MKKEDNYTMQITTVHKFQKALDGTLKVLKFIWRHAFVLISFGITIQGIYKGQTPIIEGEALILVVALFLDWFKMKFKPSPRGSNVASENMIDSIRRSRDDFSWKMNPLNPMGYTYSTYKSGNNY